MHFILESSPLNVHGQKFLDMEKQLGLHTNSLVLNICLFHMYLIWIAYLLNIPLYHSSDYYASVHLSVANFSLFLHL